MVELAPKALAGEVSAGWQGVENDGLACKLGICFQSSNILESLCELFLYGGKGGGDLAVVCEDGEEGVDGATGLVYVLRHGGGRETDF